MDAKRYLSEILGYYKYRLDNNLCTMEEINSAAKAMEANLEIYGTADDFADYFGKSKDAVWGIIKRNVPEKPRRNVVLHSFRAFLKRVPESWTKIVHGNNDNNHKS